MIYQVKVRVDNGKIETLKIEANDVEKAIIKSISTYEEYKRMGYIGDYKVEGIL